MTPGEEREGTGWSDPVIGEIAGMVAETSGFTLKGKKAFRIEKGVMERMSFLSQRTPSEYLTYLRGPMGRQELSVLAQALTVNETHFFRHPEQFGLLKTWLEKRSVPSEMNAFRVLCAGCSTGEEVYTAAMVLADAFPWVRPGCVQVVGVDIDERALETARKAEYPAWSVTRGSVPPGVIGRHLIETAAGSRRWQISQALRGMVRFERKNLMADDLGGPYDLAFCRNVLIYFEEPQKQTVLDSLVKSMKIGGVLFCGYAESLVNQSHYLELREQNGVVYYVRWTPDRRSAQAEVGLDDNRRLLIEEGGIPLVYLSSGSGGGGRKASATLVLAGVLSSNTTPESLVQRMREKRDRWLGSLPVAAGDGSRGELLLDLEGVRYAGEPYLKVFVDFARELLRGGTRLTARPPSNPRLREWMCRSPQREIFCWPEGCVEKVEFVPQPIGVGPPSPDPNRAGLALAALEQFMRDRASKGSDLDIALSAPPKVKSQDPAPPPVASPSIEIRHDESPPRLILSGRWPDDVGVVRKKEIEATLAGIAAQGPHGQSNRRPKSEAKGAAQGMGEHAGWRGVDLVVLDLSTLDYAERWLAEVLKRFRDSIRPVRLTVVGSMGTFRWLARMGAGDLA